MRDTILSTLLKLSDRQFDPAAKERVKALIGLADVDVRKPLSNLLDLCVYHSWCSDFEISVLNILVDRLLIPDEEKAEWRAELKESM